MKKLHELLIAVLIIIGFSFSNLSCIEKEEDPGPISIKNSITPTNVNSGSTIIWEITVTNSGGKVEIEKIHVKEEFISGWAEGLGTVELDLPISNITVDAHSTKSIYSKTVPVYNTGSTDIKTQNTVTVYSNGGNETDIAIYTIKKSSNKSNEINFNSLLHRNICDLIE